MVATSPQRILDILSITSGNFQSTDPRDRLFAISSVLDLDNVPELRPDYEKSAGEVFMALIKYLLEGTGLLYPLTFVSGMNDSNIPSWIPDWTRSTGGKLTETQLDQDLRDLVKFKISPDGTQLSVRVAFLAAVRRLHNAESFRGRIVRELREHMRSIDAILRGHAGSVAIENAQQGDTLRDETHDGTLPTASREDAKETASRAFRLSAADLKTLNSFPSDHSLLDDMLVDFLDQEHVETAGHCVQHHDYQPETTVRRGQLEIINILRNVFQSSHQYIVDSKYGVHRVGFQHHGSVREGNCIVAVPTCKLFLVLRRAEEGKEYRIVNVLGNPEFRNASASKMRRIILSAEQRDVVLV